jgi:nitrite reductase (NADH) small subunit
MAAVRVVAAVAKEDADRKTEYFSVARTTEIVPGRARVFYLRGIEIALFNVNGDFYAVDNLCPHEGGPLVAGTVGGRVLTCPWHRWQFDLKTGCSPVNPAIQVQIYPVLIEGEQIKIGMGAD